MINQEEYTIEELRKGYAIITGLDNGDEMTDEQIIEYMTRELEKE